MHSRTLILLLVVVSLAFCWILLPFYGAVFWAVVLAVIFSPLQRQLALRLGGRGNLSAMITLFLCLVVAVLPVLLIGLMLVQEGADFYHRLESGELDIGAYVNQFRELLPRFLQRQLDRLGIGNFNGLRDRIVSGMLQGSQFLATKAFAIGQNTFEAVAGFFVMLYLLYFFLRDGYEVARNVRMAIPLGEQHKRRLQIKFTRVVRATVKGNIVVAIVQGALGSLVFWFMDIQSPVFWGVMMAFLSLLPLVGAGLIWGPVALFFVLNGALWEGVGLALFGILVIGLVDNFLRPMLVGKDTRMPDYLVLISTLGGLSLFGLNGFVIGPLIAALFVASWDLFTEAGKKVMLP
ncbi:AI-2E family transporter [Pseudomonas sp. JS3066]|uniref:AI-2E family transporter n=1 Tax=unclassified Pseudomonas TaxID=196821 RepID=UPI000EA888C3|nr:MULTISPECIES: AI-2E family transporter [unclassified Pseudomonas]AYF86967.1 AI-2E family transporter [Pseudomonas sp. DY-1]MDH4652383.1 AI-2E family transporter [Pseudomonas sp. BN606]MRK24393.1 AI-2E family transporter [Pseudomonas sp. JG-B]WVK95540.1 AI-2E family transporter [Pseudomonas sp. JS3066]